MQIRENYGLAFAALALSVGLNQALGAQNLSQPAPITLVIPFAPGGSTSIVGPRPSPTR